MNRNELRVTAYHEAGHVVAAWSVGFRVAEVSIESARGQLGFTRFDFTPTQQMQICQSDPLTLRSLAIVGLGGLAADYNARKRESDINPEEIFTGDADDQEQVRNRLERIGQGTEGNFRAYLAVTVRLIDTSWIVVEPLANQLFAAGKLNAHEMQTFEKQIRVVGNEFWALLEAAARTEFGSG